MMCKTCYGSGVSGYCKYGSLPCEACSGMGIIHCCEGDQAQPIQQDNTQLKEDDAKKGEATTM